MLYLCVLVTICTYIISFCHSHKYKAVCKSYIRLTQNVIISTGRVYMVTNIITHEYGKHKYLNEKLTVKDVSLFEFYLILY